MRVQTPTSENPPRESGEAGWTAYIPAGLREAVGRRWGGFSPVIMTAEPRPRLA